MKLFYLTLCMALLFTLTAAYADNPVISQQQAVEMAQQQFPGRVLSVKGNADGYRVKILSAEGDIRIIKIDSAKDKNKDKKR